MNRNIIKTEQIIKLKDIKIISSYSVNNKKDFSLLIQLINKDFNIDISDDEKIVNSFVKDWSNTKGYADAIARPKNKYECAILLKICYDNDILVTISAGRTNLTGSATPNGGIIISTINMNKDEIIINDKIATAPPGIILEDFRDSVKCLSFEKLFYPVNPTSRKDAFLGGTIMCNASGFIPGFKGATRQWVDGLEFLFPNGSFIKFSRGDFISNNGKFIIEFDNSMVEMVLPIYKRPNIKNASGPFSFNNHEIDFVDMIVGSEGIFGMIVSCNMLLDYLPNDYLDLFIILESEKMAFKFYYFIKSYLKNFDGQLTALEYFGYNCQSFMKHKQKLFKNKDDVGIYLQIPIYDSLIDDESEKWLKIFLESNCNINAENIMVLTNPNDYKTFFEARHSIPVNALELSNHKGTPSIITDTIVPPKNFSKYIDYVHKILQDEKIEYLLFGHLGDCHLHFHIIPDKYQIAKAQKIYYSIINKSSEMGGVYSAEHGTGKRKKIDFEKCYGKNAVNQVQSCKAAIDPKLLLNRGNIINIESI